MLFYRNAAQAFKVTPYTELLCRYIENMGKVSTRIFFQEMFEENLNTRTMAMSA